MTQTRYLMGMHSYFSGLFSQQLPPPFHPSQWAYGWESHFSLGIASVVLVICLSLFCTFQTLILSNYFSNKMPRRLQLVSIFNGMLV